MARLRSIGVESDDDDENDELPELSQFLLSLLPPVVQNASDAMRKTPSMQILESETSRTIRDPKMIAPVSMPDLSKTKAERKSPGESLSTATPRVLPLAGDQRLESTCFTGEGVRSSPRRKAKVAIDYTKSAQRLSDASSISVDDDDSFTDLSGFIVPDSASDEEVIPSNVRGRKGVLCLVKPSNDQTTHDIASTLSPHGLESTGSIDLTSPKNNKKAPSLDRSSTQGSSCERLEETEDRNNLVKPLSELSFSPPRWKSPHKKNLGFALATPPSSPSKTRLQLPSRGSHIPPSPHRPSIDAFWSADVINDWNEQYSPRKPLQSPRKIRYKPLEKHDERSSPSESPQQNIVNMPGKRCRQEVDLRKSFERNKQALATSFLADVDRVVGSEQIATMADSTGGIKLIWSKKLSSTAGRANWRKEVVRSRNGNATISALVERHHASIELAEKVIDCEDRLYNVIAHEYCHLANFMISGVKDNPHGASFKTWAAKCTRAFEARNIHVTTKHSYEITYRYIWECSSPVCGLEYKRHSKSIDPAKHSCGRCKSHLVQIKPVPRKGEGERKMTEYRAFVKREHGRVKSQNPNAKFGEIMAILGKEFREWKKKAPAATETVDHVGLGEECLGTREGILDDVAKKLNCLNLIH